MMSPLRTRPRPPWALAGLLAASTAAGHVLYPLAIGLITRRRPVPALPPEPAPWPPVTVVVPAYREAGVIRAKVADVEANGYPGPVEILVVAEDPETASAAQDAGAAASDAGERANVPASDAGERANVPASDACERANVKVLTPTERLGKAQAVNLGVAESGTELVVLSDANNRLERGSLALIVRHLLADGVGAVAGEKVEADAGGEELYWRFESWLKQREWTLGTTIGVVGELVGLRRSAFRPIPAGISSDDLWTALDLIERGHRIAYEPGARAIDPPSALGHRWERRTRILAGSLFVFWAKRGLVSRGTSIPAFQIVGHKLWRSTAGPLSHVGLLVLSLAWARRSRLAALFLGGHVVGAGAVAWQESGRCLPTVLTPAAQALYLQGVALGGVTRFLRGDRVLRWSKVER